MKKIDTANCYERQWIRDEDRDKNIERGLIVRRTYLIAALTVVAALAVFTADAHAYLHPKLGGFTSRDPGPGSTVRTGTAGAAPTSSFIPRDASPSASNSPRIGQTGLGDQYADGPNLYQYAGSQPTTNVDPLGTMCAFGAFGRRKPSEPVRKWRLFGEIIGYKEGMTMLTEWDVSTRVVKGDCKGSCRKVSISACNCEVEYWWSDRYSYDHEKVHVGQIRRRWWNLYAKISLYSGRCMSRKKARCYSSATRLLSRAGRQLYYAEAAQFDCQVYVPPFKKKICKMYHKLIKRGRELSLDAEVQLAKCRKMN